MADQLQQGKTGTLSARGRELAAGLEGLVTAAPGGPAQASRAPFDGTVIGDVPVCTAHDVAAAVGTARLAQRHWATVPVAERCAVVRRFRGLVLDREQDIL